MVLPTQTSSLSVRKSMKAGTIKIIHKDKNSDTDTTDSMDQETDHVLSVKSHLEAMKLLIAQQILTIAKHNYISMVL